MSSIMTSQKMVINFKERKDLAAGLLFILIELFFVSGNYLASGLDWMLSVFQIYASNSIQVGSSFIGIFFVLFILSICQMASLRFLYTSRRTHSLSTLAIISLLLVIILPVIASSIILNNQYNLTLGGDHFANIFSDLAKDLQFSSLLTLLAVPLFVILSRFEEGNAFKKGFLIYSVFLIFQVLTSYLLLYRYDGFLNFNSILYSLFQYTIIIGGTFFFLKQRMNKEPRLSFKTTIWYVMMGIILGIIYSVWNINTLI